MFTYHQLTRRTLLKALAFSSVFHTSKVNAEEVSAAKRTVRAAIHPAIGIARVGNSPEEFFIGPELPWATPSPEGGYKDEAGAIKRQAARFRIYGYDEDGNVTQELTSQNASIRWTVHVANKKAEWYQFEAALDLPDGGASARRNRAFVGEDRRQLVIDPGPRSIEGPDQSGPDYRFDTGTFVGQRVYLGELRTDAQGHLLFLGGHGKAGSINNRAAADFANNDGWYDDTSDGSVRAEVILDGQSIPVDPAWVVVAPPNYAPDILSVQTMYDVIYHALQGTLLTPVEKPSFTEHIYPLLAQFSETQWVNFGFYRQFGWGGEYEFVRPEYLPQLCDPEPAFGELRSQIFRNFRDPSFLSVDPKAWPPVYGDGDKNGSDPRQFMAVTPTQYRFLQQWSEGDFLSDLSESKPAATSIEEIEVAYQPKTLDKAALYFCSGGPFHPGCEMTWPMRHASLYEFAFRLRHRDSNNPEPAYGTRIRLSDLTQPGGALTASAPGDITRWMAVPWQTDTASCRAGYDSAIDPYLPTFWPARVPNHVLTKEQYERVLDESLSMEERKQAFDSRAIWYRWLTGSYTRQINQMVSDFGKFGIVERKPGPEASDFPSVLYVESDVGFSS